MEKNLLIQISSRLDNILRRAYSRLTPEKRMIVVLALCVIFGIGSIYMTISSIYLIGKRDTGQKYMEHEHMKGFDLQATDSINQLSRKKYEQQQFNKRK